MSKEKDTLDQKLLKKGWIKYTWLLKKDGNSLKVVVPAWVVKALDLKHNDMIEIIVRKATKESVLEFIKVEVLDNE